MIPHKQRLFTVKQAVEAGLYPSERGLRWLLFKAEQNGLSKAVRRIGRRVFIDVEEYYEWVELQNNIYR